MAQRSAGLPQVIDDAFVDDMIRDLKVVGPLGVLNVGDGILPVYILGQRTAFAFEVQDVAYEPGEVFSAGELVNPAVGVVMADTLPMAAGTYDIIVMYGADGVPNFAARLEHRNAANAANINSWYYSSGANEARMWTQRLSLSLSDNERLRTIVTIQPSTTVQISILAKLRL